ncbi:Spore maturation protein CgeB [Alkaliphilus peptidifermentans DSM 18978]|uniref:Spore maturation protein CgeB n=1 Tax=Alkaliphilus peptidifermentans DSM 18978 TaxID=1120976 RepID=A0A1G5H185_9FIRM|nr:glycosyltransferase [Alkaliphilus peptidifermentans]SCY57593.1 Spore maturation protein CgeB [Alkaliphilus peptidifermentans DSM 18978]
MGHKLTYQSSWVSKEIEAGIDYFKPDILITVGYNKPLFHRFAEEIPKLCKKYNLFHLYWATEDLINHTSWSLPYIKKSKPDLVWTIHPDCIKKYESLGIPSSYLNFALNPRLFPPKKKDDKEIYDISLVGATHLFKRTYRFDSLKHLLFPLVQVGQKTHVWGYGWRKDEALIASIFGQTVPHDWLQGHLLYGVSGSVYQKSKIVLGLQNAEDQVTQRTFEILGTGAFMIASRTKAITEMFEDKKELVLTSSPKETIELVTYYLNRPDIRHEIGCNARKKIMDKYTYHQNLIKIWPKAEQLINKRKEKI